MIYEIAHEVCSNERQKFFQYQYKEASAAC